MKSLGLILIPAFLMFACERKVQTSDASCPLSPGEYPVQSVDYHADQGTYSLMIINSPACFRQPLKLKNLRLARNDDAKAAEKVKLTYNGEENSTLYMAEDFQISMTQTVTGENGVRREQSGFWSPFLAGAAGAAAGVAAGSLLSKAFSKPQYYTPPPMEAGKTRLTGFGGAGDTKEGAVRSYQQKYATGPKPSSAPLSNNSNSTTPAPTNKSSFFKSKPATAPSSGASRSYTPSSSKRSFFRSKRR